MNESTEDNPRFFDLVGSVRAMRRLHPDPVPDELLFKVLNAGVHRITTWGWLTVWPRRRP